MDPFIAWANWEVAFLLFLGFPSPGLWLAGLSERHQGDGDKEYECLHQDDESEFREIELSAAGFAGPQIKVPLRLGSLLW